MDREAMQLLASLSRLQSIGLNSYNMCYNHPELALQWEQGDFLTLLATSSSLQSLEWRFDGYVSPTQVGHISAIPNLTRLHLHSPCDLSEINRTYYSSHTVI